VLPTCPEWTADIAEIGEAVNLRAAESDVRRM
jgi:hypothetical protein